MALKRIFFDLDGTLLPMDMDGFVNRYFQVLSAKMAEHGHDPKEFMDALLKGIGAMVKNTGESSNEERFWQVFLEIMGEDFLKDKQVLDDFYEKDFCKTRDFCGYEPLADQTIKRLKEMGYPLVLATNPIFPRVATMQRIRWAGLNVEDFDLVTVYENFNYSKPNPEYYRELLRRFDAKPEECLMVGNDMREDMVAQSVGMHVFLLPEYIINPENEDISKYPHGSFEDLLEYVKHIS